MAEVKVDAIGVAALKALGMNPDRCTSLKIEFEPNSFVRATAEYWVDNAAVERVVELLGGCGSK